MTTGSLQSVASAAGAGSPDDHAALWEAFWQDRDRRARNELILAYEPLVASVVNRLPANVKAYWEIDDLKSFGLLGLVEAIERWQPSTSATRFAAYAMKRVRGAIFDELRRLDWLPRTVRRRVISYRTTADALSSELGRQPETAEVLSQMGTDGSVNSDILAEIQSAQLLHLHHSVGSEDDEDLRLIDLIVSEDAQPEVAVLASERLAEVRAAVTRLPERQRTVVTLHFLGGLTQEQIGAMLGVSNSRICQIEASAIQTLRRILADRPLSTSGAARAC
ncbi:MAG: sigma-70 family RNA polymerase sigma factor [Actinomycetota bacterium]|nr:sigma-70 family RNA polymerase sigma factor [Actinomycetota bacterium]